MSKITDEKLEYNINRKATKISPLPAGKIDRNEYLPDEQILLSDQKQIIKKAKFTYFHLRKAFQKQIKAIENQGKKQVEALEVLKPNTQKLSIRDVIPKKTFREEAQTQVDKITEIEKMVDTENLVY